MCIDFKILLFFFRDPTHDGLSTFPHCFTADNMEMECTSGFITLLSMTLLIIEDIIGAFIFRYQANLKRTIYIAKFGLFQETFFRSFRYLGQTYSVSSDISWFFPTRQSHDFKVHFFNLRAFSLDRRHFTFW